MFNIFKDTIAKDLSKIADYFNGVADAGTIFKDKRALAVNRIKNAVLNGDIGGGGGVTPEIEAEIENAQWKTETSTQLFSETVTTEGDDGYWADLTYRGVINADTLTIVFDGETYVCPKQEYEGTFYYGATHDGESDTYDFTEFPFVFCTTPYAVYSENYVQTVTPGTHTISASATTTTYTEQFVDALEAYSAGFPLVSGTTTVDEAVSALESRKLLYFYFENTNYSHFVTNIDVNNNFAISYTPEATPPSSNYVAKVDFDENHVFHAVFQLK